MPGCRPPVSDTSAGAIVPVSAKCHPKWNAKKEQNHNISTTFSRTFNQPSPVFRGRSRWEAVNGCPAFGRWFRVSPRNLHSRNRNGAAPALSAALPQTLLQKSTILNKVPYQKHREVLDEFWKINQSINQSIAQSTVQSINRPFNQSLNQSINQSINQSLNWPFNQSINRPIDQSALDSLRYCHPRWIYSVPL